MKRCPRCDQWLPLNAFTVNRRRRDGLQLYCRDCQRAYVREHYLAHTQYYLEKARRRNERVYARLRKILRALKSAPCADCGQTYPYWVMDFDHVRGEKCFNIGGALRTNADAILDEVAKCDVVCANCHRNRTYQRLIARP